MGKVHDIKELAHLRDLNRMYAESNELEKRLSVVEKEIDRFTNLVVSGIEYSAAQLDKYLSKQDVAKIAKNMDYLSGYKRGMTFSEAVLHTENEIIRKYNHQLIVESKPEHYHRKPRISVDNIGNMIFVLDEVNKLCMFYNDYETYFDRSNYQYPSEGKRYEKKFETNLEKQIITVRYYAAEGFPGYGSIKQAWGREITTSINYRMVNHFTIFIDLGSNAIVPHDKLNDLGLVLLEKHYTMGNEHTKHVKFGSPINYIPKQGVKGGFYGT